VFRFLRSIGIKTLTFTAKQVQLDENTALNPGGVYWNKRRRENIVNLLRRMRQAPNKRQQVSAITLIKKKNLMRKCFTGGHLGHWKGESRSGRARDGKMGEEKGRTGSHGSVQQTEGGKAQCHMYKG